MQATPHVVERFGGTLQTIAPEDQGFRPFTVKNPEFVEVPGCLGIEELRLGAHTMPAFEPHSVPIDSTLTNLKTIQIPMYGLVEGPSGHPVIRRSLNSNDGQWQVGAVIYVKGDWVDENTGSHDGFEKRNLKELRDLAKAEFGKEFPAVGAKKIDVVAFIRDARASRDTQ